MPRNGDGSSDNAPPKGVDHNIAHGAGTKDLGDKVARAEKTAPLPEPEHGQGLQDAPASGGQSQGLAKGDNVGQGGRGSSN
ncbi:unnamed protein product [Clonostachys rosea]|uniref:Uncharacterized protein n=1 Tax=Bionectria ochroleuca TaxID=29856 RepID=A0ABY6U0Z2_BIOOC|nr:unnamed protein product [Clonostachys rosea]